MKPIVLICLAITLSSGMISCTEGLQSAIYQKISAEASQNKTGILSVYCAVAAFFITIAFGVVSIMKVNISKLIAAFLVLWIALFLIFGHTFHVL